MENKHLILGLVSKRHEQLCLTRDEGNPASSEAEKWSALNTCQYSTVQYSTVYYRTVQYLPLQLQLLALLLFVAPLGVRPEVETGVLVFYLFMAKHLHSSSSPHSHSNCGCEYDIKIYKWLGRGNSYYGSYSSECNKQKLGF